MDGEYCCLLSCSGQSEEVAASELYDLDVKIYTVDSESLSQQLKEFTQLYENQLARNEVLNESVINLETQEVMAREIQDVLEGCENEIRAGPISDINNERTRILRPAQ